VNPNQRGGPSDDQRRAFNRELGNQRRAFAAAFAAGQLPVRDRFGRPLEKGSLFVWHPPHDLVFQVDDITPILDPNQPPGYVRVTVSMTAPVTWQANQPAPDIIAVGYVKEGHAVIDGTMPTAPKPDSEPGEQLPPDPGPEPQGDEVPPTAPVEAPPPTGGEGDDPHGSGT